MRSARGQDGQTTQAGDHRHWSGPAEIRRGDVHLPVRLGRAGQWQVPGSRPGEVAPPDSRATGEAKRYQAGGRSARPRRSQKCTTSRERGRPVLKGSQERLAQKGRSEHARARCCWNLKHASSWEGGLVAVRRVERSESTLPARGCPTLENNKCVRHVHVP